MSSRTRQRQLTATVQTELEEANVRVYLELLLEEINERTEFHLRIVRWHHYSTEQTRVLVRKKEADLEEIVRTVQVFALSRNRLLNTEEVTTAIKSLIGEGEARKV